MKIPLYGLVILLVVFGFLVSSTIYFYNQTRSSTASQTHNANGFVGPIVKEPASTAPDPVDSLTKPADPRGRLSYPANVYTIGNRETLAVIAAKMNESQKYIINANSFANANSLQAGQVIAVPKLNTTTYYYRLNFIVSESVAEQTIISQRDNFNADLTDPVKVAKNSAVAYFNITNNDTFTLRSEDESKGLATVAVAKPNYTAVIGLTQPKTIGKDGFWAIAYIEEQDSTTN